MTDLSNATPAELDALEAAIKARREVLERDPVKELFERWVGLPGPSSEGLRQALDDLGFRQVKPVTEAEIEAAVRAYNGSRYESEAYSSGICRGIALSGNTVEG